VRPEPKSLVGHVHKKMAEELTHQHPAAELFRVEAPSLTGAKEWLPAMPYGHDLRIPPHLMKWALAAYLQAPLLQSLRAGGNGCMGLHVMRCHIGLKHRHDALNRALSQLFGAAGRLKSIEPVGVFASVQGAHERPDHCLLADDGQDLFTDRSMVFANDRHVRVVVGERERSKVNKYGDKCRRAGAFFQPLVLKARSGGMSKTTANIIKKHAMLAGHRMGSDPMFLHRRWLQKLSIKFQVLNANLVAMCMPYGDAYHTRSATRNAGASVQRAVVVRQARMGSRPRPVVRNAQAVIGTQYRAVSALHNKLETLR
jgi:hypothetical protein